MTTSMADRDDDDAPLAHPHDKRVLAVIRAVLLENRWPRHELEDGVPTVEVRAWASKPHPTTVGGWKALCRKIAKEAAIDRTRSEMAGGKDSVQPTDRADDHEAANSGATMDAAIDRRKAIDEIAAQLKPEERPVFVKWALGSTQAEIAKELAMEPRKVSRQVSQMRSRFKMALAPVGLLAVLSLGAYFLFRDKVGPEERAHDPRQTPSSMPTAPPVPKRPPGPELEQLAQENRAKADELRKVAAADCEARKWGKCNAHLDEAAALDAQGDGARSVVRLRGKLERGQTQDQLETKGAPGPRSVLPAAKDALVKGLAASKGQALRLVCAQAPEPSRLCDQLTASLKSAGWIVTRVPLAPVAADAAVFHGMRIDVATDASDETQAAADVLAGGLETALLFARGPDDVPPGGDAPLRLTVGVQ